MYALVQHGDVVRLGLPSTAQLNDGRWVSNYHLLTEDILIAEGWKPVEEVKPPYNPETQYLEIDMVVDEGERVVVTYRAVDIEDA